MNAETDKLIVRVVRTDKLALERIAQAEGEPVSVIVRRMLKRAIRAFDKGDPAGRPESREVQPCPN